MDQFTRSYAFVLLAVLCPLCCLRDGEDNIEDAPILDKACLHVVDEIREKRPLSSAHHFGGRFIGNGEEDDRPLLTDFCPYC